MLYAVLMAVAGLVVVLMIVIAMQSADFRLERRTTAAAPKNALYKQVNDFHLWEHWSPWAKMDPNMKVEYAGPASGPGASYAWSGNGKVGEGRMTILESKPDELVRVKLEFLKPFKATNTAEFNFRPVAQDTEVVWAMTGHKNFMMKGMHLLMNMEKIVGKEFDKGLADMKANAERENKR